MFEMGMEASTNTCHGACVIATCPPPTIDARALASIRHEAVGGVQQVSFEVSGRLDCCGVVAWARRGFVSGALDCPRSRFGSGLIFGGVPGSWL